MIYQIRTFTTHVYTVSVEYMDLVWDWTGLDQNGLDWTGMD